MKKFLMTFLSILASLLSSAQGDVSGSGNEMMTSHLKIYVVVTVLVIILTCIFIFLFSMERRLKQLEEQQKS